MKNIRERIIESSDAMGWKVKSPRLNAIANYINTNLPLYEAKIVEGFCNTDRQISGTRLRSPGKGRYGNRLIVTKRSDNSIVIDHNSAETYRQNWEVCTKVIKLEGF